MSEDRGPMKSCLTSQKSWWNREQRRIQREQGCTAEEARATLAKQIAENRRKRDETAR